MAKIFSVVNQKGGVGKTTTAVNLACVFAVMGKKILLIDIDSQGNTSSGIGIDQHNRHKTSYDLFTGHYHISEIIMASDIPKLDVIAANTNLAAVEIELLEKQNQEYILKENLSFIKDKYDYIFIDCPPSLNILTLNALTASDKVIIPMLCDFYSLEGLSHLIKTIDIVKANLNSNISIAGIIFTMYDKRNKLTEQVERDVRKHLGDLVYYTIIPRNVKVSEAPSYGKAAVIYDHKCSGARAYITLAKEIIKREEKNKEQIAGSKSEAWVAGRI